MRYDECIAMNSMYWITDKCIYNKCRLILHAWSLHVPSKFITSVKISWNCTLNLIYFSKQTLLLILVLFNKILTFIKRHIVGFLERPLYLMVEKAWFLKQSEKKSEEVNWKHELILF